MLATERSISPVMTISVIGSATKAIGMISRATNRQNRGLATPSMAMAPTTATTTTARITITSHEPSRPRQLTLATGLPPLETVGDPDGQGPVQNDGEQNQPTGSR